MSKSLQDLFSKQDEAKKVTDSQEITEVNPEEAEEIAGGARDAKGPNIACDESC